MRVLAAILVAASAAYGQGLGLTETGQDHAHPSLVLEHARVAPGSSTTLAVRFTLSPEWHLYWTNPGDSGDAPQVELALPAGVTAGAIQWPVPTRHVLPGDLLGYLYEEELVLLIPLEVGAGVKPGAYPIQAELGWLVCKDVCLMGDDALELALEVGPPQAGDAEAKALFARARARLPRAPKDGELQAELAGDALTLEVPGATKLVFFPESTPAAKDSLTAGEVEGERLTIHYGALGDATALRGILRVTKGDASYGLQVEVAVPRAD
ncbi:MAG: protein-disulfide reductase DsbD family protein [Planctomycetota bacterium]